MGDYTVGVRCVSTGQASSPRRATMTPTNESVPYGFCHCGCCTKTQIAKYNSKLYGWIKGEPRKYVKGHQGRIVPATEPEMRFKIDGMPCKLIPLTQGQWAIVWESHYAELMQWKWCARRSRRNGCFYAVRNSLHGEGKKRTILMHRYVLGLDISDSEEVDHVDPLRTTDNRDDNIRYATSRQNKQNRGVQVNSTSGFKGATFETRRGKWVGQIVVNGVRKFLGYFDTAQEAHQAYCAAARHYFGEFARAA